MFNWFIIYVEMKNEPKRKKIIKLFSKHCLKCDGLCCKKAEFTVFGWELKKIPSGSYPLILRKQWGNKGKAKDINIERVSMGIVCPYLDVKKGCIIKISSRPLDCVSYPVYPIIKYGKDKKNKIVGMMVHRSCLFSKEISKNKVLMGSMLNFWGEELKKITKKDLRDWFGNKRNYWLDKNIIKI